MTTLTSLPLFGSFLIDWGVFLLNTLFALSWPALILLVLLLYSVFRKLKSRDHAHWNTLLPNFNYSPREFYAQVLAEIQKQEIKGLNFEFVNLKEGGLLSSRRKYLRVKWKGYFYVLCAAPFADGFFLSWRLKRQWHFGHVIISRFPLIGSWLYKKLFPDTYFKVDCADMFMTYTQQSVLSVIDDITKDTGVRLSEADRKPILRDIFNR